ncbi:TetR/AcrR family transcriptional regulator [Cytobacillus oceanisediminis]|uniref:TetR family transcriptional regulator n=1 Tax=Cytobacillus oceanisediminis TaxID=665099 RepID=A0A562K6Q4_9BACI|nr:TetR/AcrR family transcriptional regulator [Cytobacillus oceanisediminis]TWH91102.1 TetR family transcriptional regulator [Cytobacillus oceanisediminis]
MDGYQLRTEKKKEQIQKAALELFKDLGIEKVSLAEIARKAKVSPVTIYNHFGTKDELVKNVVHTFLQKEWNSRLETIQQEDLSFPEKVEKLILDTATVSGINPDFLNKLVESNPELEQLIQDFFKARMKYIICFFEEGKQLGYVDPDISTESIMVYLNILQNAAKDLLFYNESSKNSKLGEDLSRLFFYGLLKKPNSDDQ